jgi:hypothetical protein
MVSVEIQNRTLKTHHDVEVAELEPGLLVRHEDLQILGQLIDGLSVISLAPIDAKEINRFLSLLRSQMLEQTERKQ